MIVWFVPPDTSSLLNPETLRDGPALCVRLSPADDDELSTAYERVRSSLPNEVQQFVDSIATDYRPENDKKQKLEQRVKELQRQFRFIAGYEVSQEAQQITFEIPASEQAQIIAALNQIVQSEDFYRKGDFDELKNLDRAALSFLKRADKGEQLSAVESERFHRLLLEGCFPDAIGKVYVKGWRPVMILYGACGIVVAAFFFIIVRNRPEDQRRCNPAELGIIAAGRPKDAPSPHGKVGNVPWGSLLSSRSMWLNCFAQVGTNIGWVFLVTWFPRYLLEQHQVPILERGLMASTPLFAGWLGMLGGGRLTDFLVTRVGLRWGRRIPWSFSRFIGMGAFIACPMLDNPWAVTAALSLVAISTDLGTASGWAFCQDVGGKYVGSILGWGNMWGNLGATASPILLAWVFESWGWPVMFYVCATAFFFAGAFAMGIDATIPIAPKDGE